MLQSSIRCIGKSILSYRSNDEAVREDHIIDLISSAGHTAKCQGRYSISFTNRLPLHQSCMYLTIRHGCASDVYNSQLCPDYVGIELGIGESLLLKAIGESTGRSLSVVKADLKKEGDLGLVAMVGLRGIASPFLLTFYSELEEQPANAFQAKATHSTIRLLQP